MAGENYRGVADRAAFMNGFPRNTLAENLDRDEISNDLAALTTQVMLSVAVPLYDGDLVNSITFLSGATALVTPTNEWAALYDTAATPALMAQSTTGTTAWAADTAKTFTLATPQLIAVTGVYYAALMIQAVTVPSLMGRSVARAAAAGAIVTGQKVLARTSGSALTTTAPGTIASPTTVANLLYCVLT